MQKSTPKNAAGRVRVRRQKKRWQKIVTVLCCAVVFCTTYALILPAVTLDADVANESDTSAASVAFEGEAGGVAVAVSAPEDAFPEGTEMTVSEAPEEAVQAAADAVDADVSDVWAVDITFTCDGQEIEPAVPISVTLESASVAGAQNAVVVHVDDEAQAEIIAETTVEDEAITFEADAFSVYAIVGTTTDENGEEVYQRYTVEFYAEENMITPTETQIVKAGDSLVRPATPDMIQNYTQFLGWYAGGAYSDDEEIWTGGTKLAFGKVTAETLAELDEADGKIDGVIKVHARFGFAVTVVFYQYYDSENSEKNVILTTVNVPRAGINLNGYAASPSEEDEYEVFDRWVLMDEDGNTKEISDAGYSYTNFSPEEDTFLYPTFTAGHSLVFDANGAGATSTATQYLKSTETTQAPAIPTRPGYTFVGWYTAPGEDGTEFYFGGNLTSNTTVYAHWVAATAKYTVVFWQQKVSDDKDITDNNAKTYDYVSSEERTVTTGSTVNATDADKAKGDQTFTTEDGVTLSYVGFQYSWADEDVVVESDGSTILNVYYDRKLITMTFNGIGEATTTYTYTSTNGNNNNTTYYGLVNGEYVQLTRDGNNWYYTVNGVQNRYTGTRYTRSSTTTKTTVMTGLYGQTLAQNGYTWPSKDESGNDVRWEWPIDDNKTTYGEYKDAFILTPATATSVEYTMDIVTNAKHVYYYLENTNGEYELVYTANIKGTGTYHVESVFTGYTPYEYSTDGRNWQKTLTAPDTNGYYADIEKGYDAVYIRYKRNTYEIDFMNGSELVQRFDVQYGTSLSTITAPDGRELTYTGASGDTAEHYTFLGWFTAPVGGEELNFNTITETMPANNRVAYAQWAVDTVTVIYDAGDGAAFTDAQGNETQTLELTVNYGETLSNPPEPYKKGYTFLGWKTLDSDGNEVSWNFNTAVTSKVKLVAQWHTDHVLNVVYNVRGETDVVVDINSYEDDATAIVYPYSKVGERFVGWSLGAFTGDYSTLYSAGDEIEVSSGNDAADGKSDYIITLYAVFAEPITTSITFDANGGEFGTDVTTDTNGNYVLSLDNNQGVDLDTITPTREGYKLIGWATSEDGEVVYKADGTETEEIAVDNDLTEGQNILYAVWQKLPRVNIKKVDSKDPDTVLSDASFNLVKDKVKVNDEDIVTDEYGVASLGYLEDGTYILNETKAPDGYIIESNGTEFTVNADGTVTMNNALLVADDDGIYTITITNTAGKALPNTGGAGTTLYTFGGLLFMACAVGCGYGLRRRQERRTK